MRRGKPSGDTEIGVAWLIVVIALAGGVNAFTSTCWTLAYTRFDLDPPQVARPRLQPA